MLRIIVYRMAKVGILDRVTPEFGVVKFAQTNSTD